MLVDNFSKYVVVGALPNRTSRTLANWFFKAIVGYFGTPFIIKSDGGNEFTADFEKMCELLNIKHWVSLPHHPASNGLAERFVKTVKHYLIRSLV